MTIPVPIETERLLLRPFTPEDVTVMLDVYGDAEVMRFIPGGAVDEAATEQMLAGYARMQETHGFAVWADAHDDHNSPASTSQVSRIYV